MEDQKVTFTAAARRPKNFEYIVKVTFTAAERPKICWGTFTSPFSEFSRINNSFCTCTRNGGFSQNRHTRTAWSTMTRRRWASYLPAGLWIEDPTPKMQKRVRDPGYPRIQSSLGPLPIHFVVEDAEGWALTYTGSGPGLVHFGPLLGRF